MAVSVGDILMMTWPGEASTQVGFDLHNAARSLGYDKTWILALAKDYKAYFTTKGEYAEGKYDSCSSLFGWKGTERIRARYVEILENDSQLATKSGTTINHREITSRFRSVRAH